MMHDMKLENITSCKIETDLQVGWHLNTITIFNNILLIYGFLIDCPSGTSSMCLFAVNTVRQYIADITIFQQNFLWLVEKIHMTFVTVYVY